MISVLSAQLRRGFSTGKANLIRSIPRSPLAKRSNEAMEGDEKVVMTDDGRVIVCWHPPKEFPYEFSKPLPPISAPTDSVLKVQALYPVREMFREKHQKIMVKELQKLTYTYHARWFGRKKRTMYREMHPNDQKRDREYL